MSKKTTVLTIIIAAVLLLAVVAIAMNAPNKKTPDETTTDTPEATQQSTPAGTEGTLDGEEQQVAATIVYSDGGFEPSSVTVKAGGKVRIENKSSMPLSFNSDDHPAHTDQAELNVGDVPKGRSREFTVTKTGTWGFHNHDNATHSGKLIVE